MMKMIVCVNSKAGKITSDVEDTFEVAVEKAVKTISRKDTRSVCIVDETGTVKWYQNKKTGMIV